MTRYRIDPIDSVFFRDGRPFEQEDEGMADVRSLFPPWPSVLAGAFRAALARAMGWDGRSDWAQDPRLEHTLGNGPEDTGALTFGPPALLCRGDGDAFLRLYAVPRHLLLENDVPFLLDPADAERFRTDLGEVDLPRTRAGVKEIEKSRIGPSELTRVLAGEAPAKDRILEEKRLFADEYRVGLQRDRYSRTAVHGMLYAASHVRLGEGVGPLERETGTVASMHRVALGLEVEGAPRDPERLGPLGGFQRPAAFERCDADWKEAREPPEPPKDGRYILYVQSPICLEGNGGRDCPGPGWSHPGLPGTLAFACTGRPVMIGGWDGRPGMHRGPRPLEPHIPPSSVLFFEGADRAALEQLWRGGARAVGRRRGLGFGRFLLGYWPRKEH